jgi:ribosomal-protein-alanine N-acetyltransferase
MLTIDFSPFPVLETGRLLLRSIHAGDLPQLYMLRSDARVLEYLDRAPVASMAEAEIFLQKILAQQRTNEGILWAIARKEAPGKMIGTIGYWRLMPEHYRAEIGYLLDPAEWGKGMMKEALHAAIHYAFEKMGLHSIEANVNPANTASAALLKSCGFTKEAHFKENYFYNGVFSDSAIYSLVNGDRVATTSV